jgi:serine/threonine-protein kinase RsbW
MGRFGYDQAAVFGVRTALEEVISNAIHHGNNGDPAATVTLRYAADPASVEIEVEDQGLGFDPRSVPDPTAPENVDLPCGRGIMLMRAYVTEVEFPPPGNRVRLRYVRNAAR